MCNIVVEWKSKPTAVSILSLTVRLAVMTVGTWYLGIYNLNKLHNTLALPVLLCGSETWTVKASDGRRITATEMKHMRRTAGYTWDRLQNKCTNCKGVKNNTNFGQITGTQQKKDRTCK